MKKIILFVIVFILSAIVCRRYPVFIKEHFTWPVILAILFFFLIFIPFLERCFWGNSTEIERKILDYIEKHKRMFVVFSASTFMILSALILILGKNHII